MKLARLYLNSIGLGNAKLMRTEQVGSSVKIHFTPYGKNYTNTVTATIFDLMSL